MDEGLGGGLAICFIALVGGYYAAEVWHVYRVESLLVLEVLSCGLMAAVVVWASVRTLQAMKK